MGRLLRYGGHLAVLGVLVATLGCAPALIGAGATGAYKTGTDERTIGDMWDDASITTEINGKLLADPVTSALKIDVDTIERVVILTGVVETEEEAQRAVAIAEAIQGVKAVDNNLQIGDKTFGRSVDDHMLSNKIKAKLIGEPGIRSLNIDVDVHNGIVTLTGIVKTGEQKQKVLDIAQGTHGIFEIVDKLRVRVP